MNPNRIQALRRILNKLDSGHQPQPTPGHNTGIHLIDAGLTIYLHADEALAKAHDYSGRGYAGGSSAPEGRGKGGHTDPTPQAAHLDASMPGTPDDYTAIRQELLAHLTETAAHATTVTRTIHRINTTAPPATAKDQARCSEYATGGCEDLAVKDRRCNACYQWLRNHPGHSHVPPATILERRTRRATA